MKRKMSRNNYTMTKAATLALLLTLAAAYQPWPAGQYGSQDKSPDSGLRAVGGLVLDKG